MRTLAATTTVVLLCSAMTADRVGARQSTAAETGDGVHDARCYLTNYVQQGINSFTGAFVAAACRSLPPQDQQRLDPMITGFNPADMYAIDHIRRVLQTFPGVFSRIIEFSIHEESVSAKTSDETVSLTNPALDRILDFVAEIGLVAIIHNDIDTPFAKTDAASADVAQMSALLKRHPNAAIIWVHVDLGRIVHPVRTSAETAERSASHVGVVEAMLTDPALRHVTFDISWDEVATNAVASPESVSRVAAVLNRFPDRFLFGTDTVAPPEAAPSYAVYDTSKPVWDRLTADASFQIRKGNYERLFNQGRLRVRSWERANVN